MEQRRHHRFSKCELSVHGGLGVGGLGVGGRVGGGCKVLGNAGAPTLSRDRHSRTADGGGRGAEHARDTRTGE